MIESFILMKKDAFNFSLILFMFAISFDKIEQLKQNVTTFFSVPLSVLFNNSWKRSSLNVLTHAHTHTERERTSNWDMILGDV